MPEIAVLTSVYPPFNDRILHKKAKSLVRLDFDTQESKLPYVWHFSPAKLDVPATFSACPISSTPGGIPIFAEATALLVAHCFITPLRSSDNKVPTLPRRNLTHGRTK